MNIHERAEIELGIRNIGALTHHGYKRYEVAPPFPKDELKGAQRAFAEAFEGKPGLTQIDPSRFFIATAKGGVVKREYYRPTSDGEEAFAFNPQASCEIGSIQGRFGINVEWRQDANFRRDSLTIFPFNDEMRLRLKPGEELAIDWNEGVISEIKLLTKSLKKGRVNTHHTFATMNAYEEALKRGNVRFLPDHYSIGRFQRTVDLDYLRADETERHMMDSLMTTLVKDIEPIEFSKAYLPIDMLNLQNDKENGRAITVEQVTSDDDEANPETGITVKRFESPTQEGLPLDDIFIPEPFDPLALAATIFRRDMLIRPENAPLELDKEWLNQHSVVRQLIGLRWVRRNPDLRKGSFKSSADSNS